MKSLDELAAAHVEEKKLKKATDQKLKVMAADRARKKRKKRQETGAKGLRVQALKRLMPKTQADGPPVDPVIQELAKRELARRRLIQFVLQFHPRYKAGWVHHDICQRLEKFAAAVDRGESPRLMLLMPPRHGKSQLASKLYPAWHLGHYPHHEFIGCSYNISLALDFSREIRDVIKSTQYAKLFPKTALNPDFMSAEAWRLQSSTGVGAGGYNAAGVGGGITGKGAHVLVIDDPVKNAEEAESPDIRQKIWDWYTSSAYTRLAPGGGVLVIQTWWNDDDLAGRLQTAMKEDPDADKFEVIKYPAVAEEDEAFRQKGEALHPERYDLTALDRIKRTLGDRHWSALYQQSPVSLENAFFSKDMFQYRTETPQLCDMDIYQAWDLAISNKQQKANNWTVGFTVGLDCRDNVHVLERVRMKTNDSAEIEDAILDMYARYPRIAGIGFENGQIWKTMRSSLQRRMVERRIYMALSDDMVLQPITDKEVRARPLQARMQNRKVTWPRGQEWVDEVIKEFTRFPGGAQDDQVDSLAWAIQLLLGKSPPAEPVYRGKRMEKTVEEKIRDFARFGGKDFSHMAA